MITATAEVRGSYDLENTCISCSKTALKNEIGSKFLYI